LHGSLFDFVFHELSAATKAAVVASSTPSSAGPSAIAVRPPAIAAIIASVIAATVPSVVTVIRIEAPAIVIRAVSVLGAISVITIASGGAPAHDGRDHQGYENP
jgi:hypothetical protein